MDKEKFFKEQSKKLRQINKNEKLCCDSLVFKYIRIFKEINFLGDWEERFRKILKLPKYGFTLERCITVYGEELGTKKFKQYSERQAYTNSKEYKGMTDAQFKEYNRSRAVTLENLIKKYGEEKGKEAWEKYKERQAYTNSKEYFIEKYGEELGTKKYFNVNYNKGHSLERYIKKYGEELGEQKFLKYIKTHENFYSNLASNFFKRLDEHFNFSNAYYAPKTKEFGKINKEHKKYFFYDFVIPEIKFCIEFNGDVFHANPKLFLENDRPNPFNKNLTSKDIWENDKIKEDTLKNCGFDVLKIWEMDYNNNPEEIFNLTVKIIEKKYESRK